MIEIKNLHKSFGHVEVLKGVDVLKHFVVAANTWNATTTKCFATLLFL